MQLLCLLTTKPFSVKIVINPEPILLPTFQQICISLPVVSSVEVKALLQVLLVQKGAALISTSSSLCHVDYEATVQNLPPKFKRQRRLRGADIHSEKGQNLRIIPLQQICLACLFTSRTSAILLEKDWMSVQQTLPAPVYRHRFGT